MERVIPMNILVSFLTFVFVIPFGFCQNVAATTSATITRLEGEAYILKPFSSGEKKMGKDLGTLSKYEGKNYWHRSAQLGDHVEYGDHLRTAPQSKVYLTYPNGNQIQVAQGTIFEVKKSEGEPQLQMNFGKIRAIINKKLPKGSNIVRTKSAVMGVRGTDFSVQAKTENRNETELAVYRGEVAMNGASIPGGKTGITKWAPINTKKEERLAAPKIEALKKENVLQALQDFRIASVPKNDELKSMEEVVNKETLKSLGKNNEEVAAQGDEKSLDARDLSLKDAFEKAEGTSTSFELPKEVPFKKPSREQLDDIQEQHKKDDAYKKYYKR
jgi:hypothetical protein